MVEQGPAVTCWYLTLGRPMHRCFRVLQPVEEPSPGVVSGDGFRQGADLPRCLGPGWPGESLSGNCGMVFTVYDYRCRRDRPRSQPGSQRLILLAWSCFACGTGCAFRRRWGSGSGLVWRVWGSSCRCRVPWLFAVFLGQGGVGTPCAPGSGSWPGRTFGISCVGPRRRPRALPERCCCR